MKNVFFILVIFFLCNTAGAYSDINQTQKDSVITVSFGTLSIESFLETNTEGIFSESRIKILKGDTVMADNASIHMIKLKDEFPWSIIDYEEAVIFKYFLSSHNILEAQVIKETTKKYLYRRSGEDIFPSIWILLFGAGLLVIVTIVFSQLRFFQYDKSKESGPLFYIFSEIIFVLCVVLGISVYSSVQSLKLIIFFSGVYGFIALIAFSLGRFYLKKRLRKEKLIAQNT